MEVAERRQQTVSSAALERRQIAVARVLFATAAVPAQLICGWAPFLLLLLLSLRLDEVSARARPQLGPVRALCGGRAVLV